MRRLVQLAWRNMSIVVVGGALLLVALCLYLTSFALFGSLGYENSLVLAPVFSLLGIGVGIEGIRRARGRGQPIPLPILAGWGARDLGILLVVALAIVLLGRLWLRDCDPAGGFVFFAMAPAISGMLGWVCGIWGGSLAHRRRYQLILGLLPFLACLAIALRRLYADPVVFAYDPFWGYFSGSIYDEGVTVGETYVLFRVYNLIAAGAALALWSAVIDRSSLTVARLRFARARLGPSIVAAALIASASWFGLQPARHGFTADVSSIREVLSRTMQTEHFIIYYAPRSATARTIETIAREHEFAWHRLKTGMNGREPAERVESFVFVNPRQKRHLMGAGAVQVAAPWRRQIYLNETAFPPPVLHHELAHIFGATIGDPIFGASIDIPRINIGLIEGFASAMAPEPRDGLDLHDQVTVLDRLGLRPPLAEIMGTGFYNQSGPVAYTTAGSFCQWLIATYGFEPMATLYSTAGDFEAAYDTELAELERRWLAFLGEREGVSEDDVRAQAQRFKRPSIFARPCAHRAADLRDEIGTATDRGDFDRALRSYEELCALEPEDPSHRIGLAVALAVLERFEDALSILAELADQPDLTVAVRAAIIERQGDLQLILGDLSAAKTSYEAALELPVSEAGRRVLSLKSWSTHDPDLARLVIDYFALVPGDNDAHTQSVTGTAIAAQIRELPHHEALGSYLLALRIANVERPDLAARLFERALDPPPDDVGLPTDDFVRAARLGLLTARTQLGEIQRARTVLEALDAEPSVRNGDRLIYERWRERLDFFESSASSDEADARGEPAGAAIITPE